MNTQKGNILAWIVLIIAIAAIAVLAFLGDQATPQQDNGEVIDTTTWNTYTNDAYAFSLKHPDGWEVKATSEPLGPRITVYKVASLEDAQPPFDHHQNQTHVSVYPHGIPTEGVIGQTQPTNVSLSGIETRIANDYVFEEGGVWGTYISPAERPASWNEPGFVWAKVKINDLETDWVRDGEKVGPETCDPLVTDDKIIWHGTINEQDRAIEKAILESFEFQDTQEQTNLISVETPAPGAVLESPTQIAGEARGYWYFEASFPVQLKTSDGTVLATAIAQAQDEWMTESFVPFTAILEFDAPETETEGVLVFKKANPSGLPENEDSFEVPVTIAPAP